VSTGWAGAERSGERRSSSLLRLSYPLFALVYLTAVAAGCGERPEPPSHLVDGTATAQPPVALEGVDSPVVLTRVRATGAPEVAPGSPEGSCLAGPARGAKPIGEVATRVGVSSESVTFRERSAVIGCDATVATSGGGGRWCGGSFGRLFGERLRDPRLDIAACRTAAGDSVAFAWIEPRGDARYVTIVQPGYAEVYPVVPGLPVRVATVSGIESDPIGAEFDVTEHDADGRLLRRYRVTARPSG
jgi:hypothetical protein